MSGGLVTCWYINMKGICMYICIYVDSFVNIGFPSVWTNFVYT